MARRLEQKKEVGLQDLRGQGGGPKPRLTPQQRTELKQLLTDESDFWTCGEIPTRIQTQFLVSYSKRQVQRLMRRMGMYCYKPQPRDHRQRVDHASQLTTR